MQLDTIYILSYNNSLSHDISKQLRDLGYYTKIIFPSNLTNLKNAKGLIISPSDELSFKTNLDKVKNLIKKQNIPFLQYNKTDDLLMFVKNNCKMQKNWDYSFVLENILNDIKNKTKNKKALLFLSGGVDSTIAFALLNKALGKERVLGLHINNGFMRKNESEIIAQRYKKHGLDNFIVEDASDVFLEAVYKIVDPQLKRKAVGETFIKVRDQVVARLNLNVDEWLLVQGTLLPDVLESGSDGGENLIKTHHNCVDGIQALIEAGLILEPLKYLYKNEVRILGKKLGLSDELVFRHPFPGPGLSINVLCSNGEKAFSKKDKDNIEQAKKDFERFDFNPHLGIDVGRFNSICDYEIIPVRSVGVENNKRTYKFPLALSFLQQEKESNFFKRVPGLHNYLYTANPVIKQSKHINRVIVKLWENPLVKKENKTLRLIEAYCTKERLDQTREVDAIMLEELKNSESYNEVFQHLTINIPYATEENRCSIVLRPVVSDDVMTAEYANIDSLILKYTVERIAALGFVDVLYYDITNKPPATIGWE